MLQAVRLDVDLRTGEFLVARRARAVVEDLDRSRERARIPALSRADVTVGAGGGQCGEQEVGHSESSSGGRAAGVVLGESEHRGAMGIPAAEDQRIHLGDLGWGENPCRQRRADEIVDSCHSSHRTGPIRPRW